MKVLIEGAGSAALRLARASVECGLDVRISPHRPQAFEKFYNRHIKKFSQPPSTKIMPSERGETFPLVFIATPGSAHESALFEINEMLRTQPTAPLKFFEKPLLLEQSLAAQDKIACLSQMTFDEGFKHFLHKVARKSESVGIRRITSQFRESLDNAVSAHPWAHSFRESWISDDSLGGGALNEFCHPFFWTGEVLRECRIDFPRMEVTDLSVRRLGETECTDFASLKGSTGNTTIEIGQEILLKDQRLKKDIRVTFEDNLELCFDWVSVGSGYSPENASRNLVRYLAGLDPEIGIGPHNDSAIWADEALKSLSPN